MARLARRVYRPLLSQVTVVNEFGFRQAGPLREAAPALLHLHPRRPGQAALNPESWAGEPGRPETGKMTGCQPADSRQTLTQLTGWPEVKKGANDE